MECLQVTDPNGTLELGESTVPEIGSTDVLIDVEATSVGRTVYNNIRRKLDDTSTFPTIPGHEIVGRVSEVGSGVNRVSKGDFVTNHYYLFCGNCEYCESGYEPMCENLRGNVGVDVDGGFAEYVRLPARNVVRLPNELDAIDATAIPDAIATPFHIADRRAKISPGDDVMILGAGGGVGIHLVQVADYYGGKVAAVDQRSDKLKLCTELGASDTIDTEEESIASTERAYDVVVDFTGDMELVSAATDLIAPHGRVVHLTPFQDRTVDLTPRDFVWNEFDVVGSRYCSRSEIRKSARLVADGIVEPVVTEIVTLDGVPDLLQRIAAGDHGGRGAVTP